MTLTGNYYIDLSILAKLDVEDLENFCEIDDRDVQLICNSNDFLRMLEEKRMYENIPFLTMDDLDRNKGLAERRDRYWTLHDPESFYTLGEADEFIPRFSMYQSADNRYVLWPTYHVAGFIENIVKVFRDAGYDVTKELIMQTAIDPFSAEGQELILKSKSQIYRISFQPIEGLENYVYLINNKPLKNPNEIVINKPSGYLRFEKARKPRATLTISLMINLEGVTRQELFDMISDTIITYYYDDSFNINKKFERLENIALLGVYTFENNVYIAELATILR